MHRSSAARVHVTGAAILYMAVDAPSRASRCDSLSTGQRFPITVIAGFAARHEGASNCPVRATVWFSTGAGDFAVLGDTMPAHLAGNQSQVEGMTNVDERGCLTLVGLDLEQDLATIWYGGGHGWCAEDLNEISMPRSGPVLQMAHDVNVHRHVTAVALDSTAGDYYPAILSCSGDLNGDLRVNGPDRTLLIAQYYARCSTTALDEYDLDGDGVINAADLAILIGQYSGTDSCDVDSICLCEEGEIMSLDQPMDESLALAAYGFENWFDFSDWLITADPVEADTVCLSISLLLNDSL